MKGVDPNHIGKILVWVLRDICGNTVPIEKELLVWKNDIVEQRQIR